MANGQVRAEQGVQENKEYSASNQKWSIEYDADGPNSSILGLSVDYNFDEKVMVGLGFSYQEDSTFQCLYFDIQGRYNFNTDGNLTHDYFQPFVILGYGYSTSTQQILYSAPPEWDTNTQLLIFGPGCEFLFGKQFGIGVVLDDQIPIAKTSNFGVLPFEWGLIVNPTFFLRFRFG